MPIQIYQNDGVVGYSKISVQNLAYESEAPISLIQKVEAIWFYGKCKNLSLPGWNGYIERLTSGIQNFSKSCSNVESNSKNDDFDDINEETIDVSFSHIQIEKEDDYEEEESEENANT